MASIADVLGKADEQKLRDLAYGVAKGIEPVEALLERLSFTMEDYALLAESNTFKRLLREAIGEWQGASNIQKRIKLKSAVNIEESLPAMYHAMVDGREPLAARVKVFETLARMARVGVAEQAAAVGGQAFRLEINLGGLHGEGGLREEGDPPHRETIVITPAFAGASSAFAGASSAPGSSPGAGVEEFNRALRGGMEEWEDGWGV